MHSSPSPVLCPGESGARRRDLCRAFDSLRTKLAHKKTQGKRLSKIQALRSAPHSPCQPWGLVRRKGLDSYAIQYISDLEDVLFLEETQGQWPQAQVRPSLSQLGPGCERSVD